MIPDFYVYFCGTLAEAIGEASSNIFTESVIAFVSGNDSYAADCAAIPPRPVGIADHAHARRCGFTRPVVPTDSADRVST